MREERIWQRSAGSQIILNSIFAALAGIWINLAVVDELHAAFKLVEIACSLLAFLFFATSAEGIVTAYDESDVIKYVYYLLWYNAGVVLIGFAIGFLILAHFEAGFLRYVPNLVVCNFTVPKSVLIIIMFAALFVVLLLRWIKDAGWLLFTRRAKFEGYVKELTGAKTPTPERGLLMRWVFFRHRVGIRMIGDAST